MATITVHGASDDLVEITGAIAGCDEYGFYLSEEDPEKRWGYIAASDGTVLRIGYAVDDTGCWRVRVDHYGAAQARTLQTGDDEAEKSIGRDYAPYSDVVTLDGEIAWVKFFGRDRDTARAAAGAPPVCPQCKDGVASGWVKCDGTGAEEHLDWPCQCPAGEAVAAKAGPDWRLGDSL